MAENHDYCGDNAIHKNRKYVRAINLNTNQFLYFYSSHSVQEHFGMNKKSVKWVCNDVRRSATPKIDGQKYTFLYITEQQLPKDYFKSDQQRKQNQIQSISGKTKNICPKCDKKINNHNKKYCIG